MRYKCGKHHSAYAGWRCGACSATLCPDCVAQQTAGTTQMESCLRCGGVAHQLKVPRSVLEPFGFGALLRAMAWPLSPTGLLCIAACTVLATLLGVVGSKGTALATGVIVAYLFQIVRHTARGADDFPGPEDFQGYFEDIVGPSLRLTVALAWIWLPALVFVLWPGRQAYDPMAEQQMHVREALKPGGSGLAVTRGTKVVSTPTGIEIIPEDAAPPPVSPEQLEAQKAEEELARQGPRIAESSTGKPNYLVAAILALLGVAIAPMSLLASALKTPLSVAANPVVLFGYALKLGKDYALLIAFCVLAAILAFVTRLVGHAAIPVPLAGSMAANLGSLTLAFGVFRGIGLLVRTRGVDLGYGGEEAYLVPALGDVQARGVIRQAQPVPAAAPARVEHLEPPPPADAVEEMTRAIAQDDEACLAVLEQHGPQVPAKCASSERWMKIAKVAVQLQKPRQAVLALRRCLDVAAEGPLAPQAWLLAARVYDEHLEDRATSNKLLAELAKRFPASKEGTFAAERLAQLAKPS